MLLKVLGVVIFTVCVFAEETDVQIKYTIDHLQKRIQDLEWGALHISAAAACNGLVPDGGSGVWANTVIAKDPNTVCSKTCSRKGLTCNGHVSINGMMGKAKTYGQTVGLLYNYGCNYNGHQLDEVEMNGDFLGTDVRLNYYAFCCCKK